MPDPTSDNDALARFLATDPADVGCTEALRLLDVYADLLAVGEDPEARHPGLAVHFRECGPCAEDLAGLLASLRADPGAPR
jgi:hypothetical protein